MSELIHHFTQYEDIEADELFELVREAVEQSIDPQKHMRKYYDKPYLDPRLM